MSNRIRVIVTGASGKMGREVVRAVAEDGALELAGIVSRSLARNASKAPESAGSAPVAANLQDLLSRVKADVLVDFTTAEAGVDHAKLAIAHGIAPVIGTTGIGREEVDELRQLAARAGVGVVIAANFAVGAILMMHFARIAARYFDYAEIIELHHQQKLDAPSGTALATARAMAAERGQSFVNPETKKETLAGTRGGVFEGIGIHSVRMPGLVASQEVILGSLGQTLTIRHDTIGRESFMPGVVFAIKTVAHSTDFIEGLEPLLGLS